MCSRRADAPAPPARPAPAAVPDVDTERGGDARQFRQAQVFALAAFDRRDRARSHLRLTLQSGLRQPYRLPGRLYPPSELGVELRQPRRVRVKVRDGADLPSGGPAVRAGRAPSEPAPATLGTVATRANAARGRPLPARAAGRRHGSGQGQGGRRATTSPPGRSAGPPARRHGPRCWASSPAPRLVGGGSVPGVAAHAGRS